MTTAGFSGPSAELASTRIAATDARNDGLSRSPCRYSSFSTTTPPRPTAQRSPLDARRWTSRPGLSAASPPGTTSRPTMSPESSWSSSVRILSAGLRTAHAPLTRSPGRSVPPSGRAQSRGTRHSHGTVEQLSARQGVRVWRLQLRRQSTAVAIVRRGIRPNQISHFSTRVRKLYCCNNFRWTGRCLSLSNPTVLPGRELQ